MLPCTCPTPTTVLVVGVVQLRAFWPKCVVSVGCDHRRPKSSRGVGTSASRAWVLSVPVPGHRPRVVRSAGGEGDRNGALQGVDRYLDDGRRGQLVGCGAWWGQQRRADLRARARCTDDCSRAQSRVRRWLMPTALCPATVTSPAPRPSKHTRRDHGVCCTGPRWTATSACAQGDQRLGPHVAEPPHRPADVVVPQRIVAGHDHVEPRASRRAPAAPRPRRCAAARRRLQRPGTPRGRRRRRTGPSRARARAGRRRATTPAERRPLARARGTRCRAAVVLHRPRETGCWHDRRQAISSPWRGTASTPRAPGHRDGDPGQLAWRMRRPSQRHAGLVGRAVALGQVARAAGRGDVLPRVLTAARPRQDVVDRVGEAAAVLAAVIVAGEHGTTRQRGAAVVRHLDDVAQPDDERARDRQRLGVHERAVVLDDVGLVGQHEARGATGGHDGERLVRRIQDRARCSWAATLPSLSAEARCGIADRPPRRVSRQSTRLHHSR